MSFRTKSLLLLAGGAGLALLFSTTFQVENPSTSSQPQANQSSVAASPQANDETGTLAIYYTSFGAIGNGITDDYPAILAAHKYANSVENGGDSIPTVFGEEGAVYYIGNAEETIEIKTNVDWNNCTFILDDYIDEDEDGRNDVDITKDIFVIQSAYDALDLSALIDYGIVLNRESKSISVIADYVRGELSIPEEKLPYNSDIARIELAKCDELLVYVENENVRQYIRSGANSKEDGDGSSQQELFLINKNGRILNDIFWDFEAITRIKIYPVDNIPLIIQNGNFITYTNNKVIEEDGSDTGYTKRGIQINRARVTLNNINHMLDEEANEITPVSPQTNGQGNKSIGFLRTHFGASYFALINSKITPHQPINSTSGSYDISLNNVVNVLLDNVSYPSQDNNDAKWYEAYISNVDGRWKRWGIMASNYAKDVTIINSKINRVDSHNGIWNLTVRDSVVGQYGFTLTGGGDFTAENITVDGSNYLVGLRGDYGSTWKGNMYLNNIHMILPPMYASLISYENSGGWDYGYDCYYPDITLRNLTIDDKLSASPISLIPIYQDIQKARKSPYNFMNSIIMENIKRESGKSFSVFPSKEYLDMKYYGSNEKTNVYLHNIALNEDDVGIYNTDSSQFRVHIDE